MKKVIIGIFTFLLFGTFASAQINTPAPSPTAKFEQKVGLTDITIEYSRPGVKDRVIFAADGLVPFSEIWRTGANQSTKISFSDDVKLEGHDVPAGKYALYTIPNAETWTIMIYKDLTLGGNVANYKQEDELVRFTVKPEKMTFKLESFTIDVGNLRDGSAQIGLIWEETYVPIKLTVDYDSKVTKQIEQTLENPMASVAGNYLNAAWYYYNEDKDLGQALVWAEKGLEYSNSPFKFFWTHRKAMIHAKLGDHKRAIATANEAHALGQNATDNAKAFYDNTVKAQIDENIEKWGKGMN